ncbi:hypothetical protein [Kocuria turfanensis]|uniref:Uncharacterized protein n=1 Tax=Kocuria turfanensis TaxID=388357 RepID=A0A512ICP0_9MICC|nr:hypothetical protein [Kocuria turfanensis]GEO95475.1 hypothetical protein KTU01_15980 [Kocuria turfanensis]
MSFWGKIALVAAGGLLGAAATRIPRTPGRDLSVPGAAGTGRTPRAGDWRSRLYRFAATVRAGMDEREAELRESFGVRAPGAGSARLAGGTATRQVLDGTATPQEGRPPAEPTDPSTPPSTPPSTHREGKHR